MLGTVNYLAKFIPNMSTITAPIRELLKQENQFYWGPTQEQAFENIKIILSKAPVLTFFDVTQLITMACDASNSGLGAVLLQNNKPVAYASRSLTDAETRYAPIEKELLAIVFGLERFNQYTYGNSVLVESDHRPLEAIVTKPLVSAPPRLQRMLFRIQKYNFTVKYVPGKEQIVSDTLSRVYVEGQMDENIDLDNSAQVHMIMTYLPASDSKLEEIKAEIERDLQMHTLKQIALNGWPQTKEQTPKEIQDYWNFRDEVLVINDILLKGQSSIFLILSERKC